MARLDPAWTGSFNGRGPIFAPPGKWPSLHSRLKRTAKTAFFEHFRPNIRTPACCSFMVLFDWYFSSAPTYPPPGGGTMIKIPHGLCDFFRFSSNRAQQHGFDRCLLVFPGLHPRETSAPCFFRSKMAQRTVYWRFYGQKWPFWAFLAHVEDGPHWACFWPFLHSPAPAAPFWCMFDG